MGRHVPSVRKVGFTVWGLSGTKGLRSIKQWPSSCQLTHCNKPTAFSALCCGCALIFQDSESLIQGHRCLLQREKSHHGHVNAVYWGPSWDKVALRVFNQIEVCVACSYRFPNTVDVKLQRHSFWYFLFHRFHLDRSGGDNRGMQGPSGGRPKKKSQSVTDWSMKPTMCVFTNVLITDKKKKCAHGNYFLNDMMCVKILLSLWYLLGLSPGCGVVNWNSQDATAGCWCAPSGG